MDFPQGNFYCRKIDFSDKGRQHFNIFKQRGNILTCSFASSSKVSSTNNLPMASPNIFTVCLEHVFHRDCLDPIPIIIFRYKENNQNVILFKSK